MKFNARHLQEIVAMGDEATPTRLPSPLFFSSKCLVLLSMTGHLWWPSCRFGMCYKMKVKCPATWAGRYTNPEDCVWYWTHKSFHASRKHACQPKKMLVIPLGLSDTVFLECVSSSENMPLQLEPWIHSGNVAGICETYSWFWASIVGTIISGM